MACNNSAKRKVFCFKWSVENVSYFWLKTGKKIESPSFIVDTMEKTKWRLWLYPRGDSDGNYIGCFLNREKDSLGPDNVDIGFEISLLEINGSTLKTRQSTKSSFKKEEAFGFNKFPRPKKLFDAERDFLSQDILTVRCRMWKIDEQFPEEGQCFAVTRIGVKRRTFVWAIENFTALEPDKKNCYQIQSVSEEKTIMALNLYSTGGHCCDETIRIELISLDPDSITFCTFRSLLVDAKGNASPCGESEFSFDNVNAVKEMVLYPSKKKLIARKSFYLPKDVLTLQCEFAYSTEIVMEEIESIDHGCTSFQTRKPTDGLMDSKESSFASSNALKENLKSLYSDGLLSDTKLQTVTGTFPAHRSILSARSPVFKAMFGNDMKEKVEECVHIEDLNDDTVRRMLLYVYMAVVDDLQWESASQLYVAADKYQILTLKAKCSEFLKPLICSANACELLVLSDMHHDDDLKSYVQDFILKNDEDIMTSDDWKNLMETNLKLAADTMYMRY